MQCIMTECILTLIKYMVFKVLVAQWLSRVLLFVTPLTIARQAPLSVGFPRQEYWSGLPFPSPGDFPDPEMEAASPVSPVLQAKSLLTEPPGKPAAR